MILATIAGAPFSRWRMTSASGRIAFKRPRRVLERLALADRASLDRQRNRRRAEPVRGSRERHRGARRVFVEDVEDDAPVQPLARSAAPISREIELGAIEDVRDLGVAQRVDRKDVHERLAYCGAERLASASIAPWRMCAAASASTFSARLARLTSASIIARSTAWVDQRSSHSRSGKSSGCEVACEGPDRLRPRAVAAVHVEREPDDQPNDVLTLDECSQRFKILGELGPADRLGRAGEVPAGIADRDSDRLRSDIEAGDFAAARQRRGKFADVGS